MQFNQVNNNTGDVNNVVSEGGNATQNVKSTVASSESGPVVQAVGAGSTAAGENAVRVEGDRNKVEVGQPKEGFWGQAWAKVKGAWKWLVGLVG